jgi:putative ATP-dependent endonuclease of OLD family
VLITRIKIANHSRISDLDVEVRGHAVIVGANDVGKTSILRLADLLLGATTGQLYQRLGLADLADPSAELLVEAVLTTFTEEERRLFPREISIGGECATARAPATRPSSASPT